MKAKIHYFVAIVALFFSSTASAFIVGSCQFIGSSYYAVGSSVEACRAALNAAQYSDGVIALGTVSSEDANDIYYNATIYGGARTFRYAKYTCVAPQTWQVATGQCSPPPVVCTDKIGIESPHLTASGTTVPSTACFENCQVNIDVGAAGSDFWVGWGQYTGNGCTGTTAPAPAPDPDVCPAGRTIYNGVCTPLVDIPELGYGGMSINDIQKAIAKSEAAAAAKKKAAEKLVTPEYLSPSSVPSAPSIQDIDKKKAVEGAGDAGKGYAKDQGGSGDTQIIAGELGSGFGAVVTTLKDIFGGNIAGASVNGAQIDHIVQPTVKNITVSQITPVVVAHAQAVCPSTNITLQGHPAVWTYTTECNFATSIRPILLAFAWLSATFILVGGVKNG